MLEMTPTTKNFCFCRSADRLTVRRRKKPVLVCLAAATSAMAIIAPIPILGVFVYHYNVFAGSLFLGAMSLFWLPFFWDSIRRLSPKTIIFDRLHDQISFEGKMLFDLTALCRVEVDRYYIKPRKMTVKMVRVRLVAVTGQEFTALESVVYPVEEIEAVGQALADFAGVDLVCSPDSSEA